MSQPRGLSLFEAATNVGVGYGLAVLVQIAAFPAIGLSVTLLDNFRLATLFTAVSLVRSYALRQVFVQLGTGR